MTKGSSGTPAPANEGQVVNLTDTRNNQTYKVKKMQDNKCWIIDNLKYKGERGEVIEFNNTSGQYNTVNGGGDTGPNLDIGKYNDPIFGPVSSETKQCYIDNAIMPINGTLTGCGYLYNWYAATNGTGLSSVSEQNRNVDGSICPTNFRLPRSGSANDYADNDYAILNGAMYGDPGPVGGTSDNAHRLNWLNDGAWQGVSSGYWSTGLDRQGSYGLWWSSTASIDTLAYGLGITTSSGVGTAYYSSKYNGRAVRCVLNPLNP
jgi:uncharacterized protein (TIGR02145 family)